MALLFANYFACCNVTLSSQLFRCNHEKSRYFEPGKAQRHRKNALLWLSPSYVLVHLLSAMTFLVRLIYTWDDRCFQAAYAGIFPP